MPKLSSKRRQELVDHLVGNCDCDTDALFDESDTETLNKLELEDLERLAGNDESDEEEDDDDSADEAYVSEDMDDDVDTDAEFDDDELLEPDTNEEKQVTINFDQLPDEMKEDIKFARNMKQQQKDQLVAKITANEDGLFSKKELQAKSLDDLTKIASYVGNASTDKPEVEQPAPRLGGHRTGTAPTQNSDEKLDDVLDLPTINFGS